MMQTMIIEHIKSWANTHGHIHLFFDVWKSDNMTRTPPASFVPLSAAEASVGPA